MLMSEVWVLKYKFPRFSYERFLYESTNGAVDHQNIAYSLTKKYIQA